MDYCTTCRRTLNGVFVCPGCGAYAPDIAPSGSELQLARSTVAAMSEISHTREFDAFPGFPDPDVDVPVGPVTASATGRAARRRRMADWKKQRRRAVVASTVALVGGGLTLAFMPSSRPSASQAQASLTTDPTLVAPSTSSADSPDTGSGSGSGAETESGAESGARGPKHADRGNGPSKDANSPGSATAITLVDSPAKRNTSSHTTTDGARPTEDTQMSPHSPVSPEVPDAPPTAEDPTPPPNQPSEPPPASPPPSADESEDSDSGLCVLVLCVDVD